MKGYPKYEYGDIVRFNIKNEVITGKVYIIDKYGTFEDNSDVSYDILDETNNILYKHIREDKVVIVSDDF